jgi:GAF domain-containing protein
VTIDPTIEDGSSFRAALDELTGLLVAEETLETVLRRVVALACAGIGACDYASVTLMNQQVPETIVCTDRVAEEIDDVQYSNDSGPCLYAFRQREVVSVPSMADGDSWQPVRAAAMSRGVHSSFSLPLAAGDVSVGALNLYARDDHAFNSVPPESALQFAAQAAAAVWNARTYEHARSVVRHLETALETRDVIGVAKGIIMANEKVTIDEAFTILRDASQHRNVKLRDVAAEVATTGATPT